MTDKSAIGLIISGIIYVMMMIFDLEKIKLVLDRLLSSTKITLSMEARVTSTRDYTMSKTFCSVAHHVHTTLKKASCSDPLWKNIRNIKELELDMRSIVVYIFTIGHYKDGDVQVCISCDQETHTNSDINSSRLNTMERIELWKITLSSSTRGYDAIKEFIKRCTREFEDHLKVMSSDSKQTLFTVQSCTKHHGMGTRVHYSEEDYKSTKTFDNLFFPKKAELMKKIDRFENDENYYVRMGIPYKLHMMFHGSAGVSKTSAIKAIANYTGKHVIWLRLDRFESVTQICDAISSFSTDQSIDFKKCMFVIEEFDCFDEQPIKRDVNEDDHHRQEPMDLLRALTKSSQEPKVASQKSCLGTMLNTFDGIKEMHGCMVIFTTNHPEKFDPALVRAGRIDKIEFELLGAAEIAEYWKLRYDADISDKLITEMDGVKRIMSTSALSEILSHECEVAEALLLIHLTSIKIKHEL